MILRRVANRPRSLFLTFDDGPSPKATPRVLDVLAAAGARATFFLVAERVVGQVALVERFAREGHAIGNHSLDHRYRRFFAGDLALGEWVLAGARLLRQHGVRDIVGFRPPAGIVTPPLKRVLGAIGEPLILWNERFYDAVIPWGLGRALRSAARLEGGSIVLLHDHPRDLDAFCLTLGAYIQALQARGFVFEALTRDLFAVGEDFLK